MNDSSSSLCHCGCGRVTTIYRGEHRKYIHGHGERGKKHPYVKSGKDNPSCRGAASKTTRWYIRTQKPKPGSCSRCNLVTEQLEL
jgi:hypothetical protein